MNNIHTLDYLTEQENYSELPGTDGGTVISPEHRVMYANLRAEKSI